MILGSGYDPQVAKAARDGHAPMTDGTRHRLRGIYQVDYRVPPLNPSKTAAFALDASRTPRAPGRGDDRAIIAGNGRFRNRLIQTFYASPYDTNIQDWGRNPATTFLEPTGSSSIANGPGVGEVGGVYAGGGVLGLGRYEVATLNGYRGGGLLGLGAFKWDAARATEWTDDDSLEFENPDGSTFDADPNELKFKFYETVNRGEYAVASYRGRQVYISKSLAADSRWRGGGGAGDLEPPPNGEGAGKGKGKGKGKREPVLPPPEPGALDWLKANAGSVGLVVVGAVLGAWLLARRQA